MNHHELLYYNTLIHIYLIIQTYSHREHKVTFTLAVWFGKQNKLFICWFLATTCVGVANHSNV